MKDSFDKTLLVHAWSLQKAGDEYYIPFTHWIYLNEIVNYYDKVVLLSPIKQITINHSINGISINCFKNVTVYDLPYSKGGYINAIKYFFYYNKAYKKIQNVTTYYARYPVPFGWLQKIYGKENSIRRIIHYVGDPVDATLNNPNFSKLKKNLLIAGFMIENALYKWACKGADVFTNGYHIAHKLAKDNIKSHPIISSTLSESDFYFVNKKNTFKPYKFIYLGYLRKAKGIETIIRAFKLSKLSNPTIELTIVGSGDFEKELKQICEYENIDNVTFLGHIDDRKKINDLLRSHDVFLFGSLSEGSPRVILEAMANSLLVISTPVGSLPSNFVNEEDIIFADFNDENSFSKKINQVINDELNFNKIRTNSFEKVKNFTIEKFIKIIFYEG